MSEREMGTLLDRAAAGGPVMDVSIDEVVRVGRGRQRRRRTIGAAGAGALALVLAGGIWWGSGAGGLLGADGGAPAGQVEELTPEEATEGSAQDHVAPPAVELPVETDVDGDQVRIWRDGELLTPSEVPGGDSGIEVYDLGAEGTVVVLPLENDGGGGFSLPGDPVVRQLGRPVIDSAVGLQSAVRLEGAELKWEVRLLPDGTDLLGILQAPDDVQDDRLHTTWYDAHQQTVETPAGTLAVAPQKGLWALTASGQSLASLGEIDRTLIAIPHEEWQDGVMVKPEDVRGYDLVAVVPADVEPTPSMSPTSAVPIQDEHWTDIDAEHRAWTASITLPEGAQLEGTVLGLSHDPAVLLPLVTRNGDPWDYGQGQVVTLMGEPYLIGADSAGWPELSHLDDGTVISLGSTPGELEQQALTGHRWQWEGEGTLYSFAGKAIGPDTMVWIDDTPSDGDPSTEDPGVRSPYEHAVVRGPAGPVSLFTLAPGEAPPTPYVYWSGEDGSTTLLP
ncbi:hypothetical protein ACQBAT_05220 [Ornithinimicrobium sp. Y1847]|uniref:hypothetical protein n=1 Tax=Ornithinimicrobium sp. Y1847 TaxID=3405419 RepID=UPI003B678DEC